jgi:hypothetical protein
MVMGKTVVWLLLETVYTRKKTSEGTSKIAETFVKSARPRIKPINRKDSRACFEEILKKLKRRTTSSPERKPAKGSVPTT